jgi:hypothetical protein
MTAIADLLGPADRQRLTDRLAELAAIDREMRKPGLLSGSAEPPPLHRTNHDATTERTITS